MRIKHALGEIFSKLNETQKMKIAWQTDDCSSVIYLTFFFTTIHPIEDSRVIQGRVYLNKVCNVNKREVVRK